MNALSKFKSLFGEKGEKTKPSSQPKKRPNHLKEVKAEEKGHSQNNRDKAEVEILQKKIKDKLAKDPKLQKKAAMILENMLNDKKQK